MDKVSCSDRIKEGLKLRGMKQSELSKKTGISKSMISEYVKGRYEPKQNNVYSISRALNVNEMWLMGVSDDIERIPDSQRSQQSTNHSDFGSDDEIKAYFAEKGRTDLWETFKAVTSSDSLRILMDGAADLTPEDLEPVLILVQGIRKSKGLE